MSIILGFLATLVIIFLVPVVIYGVFSSFLGVKEPDEKLRFFMSVLVQKVGTALGFVLLFYVARDYFTDKWLAYSLLWFFMFAIQEVGQALGPHYSKKEAAAGIVSEFIYFPLAGLAVSRLL